MKPEENARQSIDELLEAAGWKIQDYKDLNLDASTGVAVREFPLQTGFADYMLFVDKKAVGVLEAKSKGTTLSSVADQSGKYLIGIPDKAMYAVNPLPFAYESTGIETFFRDERDPIRRSRRLFAFHKPETLREWMKNGTTLRTNLQSMPPLHKDGLRDCQIKAITELESSFSDAKPRSLIQMATGSGKTFTAVSFAYRLIKFAKAKRILFLVDRGNLGRQTLNEFQQYVTPDDGRRFTELYNVQHLNSNILDPVNKVCICTIQRLYSMLRGDKEFDPSLEEFSSFNFNGSGEEPKEVTYNPGLPIETFDFIITDECHRSIYNLWRQVLEYFDSFLIGLTATPAKQTLGFFHQNLVSEYTHEMAVADGVNVGFDVYRIKTQITDGGSTVEAQNFIDKRDRLTRERRWELLDEDMTYSSGQLDRDVVAEDQIRTVIRTFRDKLFTEIFPGRKVVPKTLIFAKDDSHAEDIVEIVKEEFGKGNEFCKKITYRATEKPEDLISSFRNSFNPRIAVTVDMIATGTDIKPLECLLFMRNIKSRIFFEQMKGRGTRTVDGNEFQSVTPDASVKTHFIIVDAVGVCESDKTDSKPLEKKPYVPLDKLLISIALGDRSDEAVSSLAGRLARLDRKFTDDEKHEISGESDGTPLHVIARKLVDSMNPDEHRKKAQEIFQVESPSEDQIKEAEKIMKDEACEIFSNPVFRNTLLEVKKRNEQTIDTVSQDTVLYAGADPLAKEKAATVVDTFRKFIEDNKDEITALSIIYSQPYRIRDLTYEAVKDLADSIRKPPFNLNMETVWHAYEQLEKLKVRGAGPDKLLTNLISLVRFALGRTDILEPFPDTVERKFEKWLEEQEKTGTIFTPEQIEWLVMIKDYIATSAIFETDAFELNPFVEKGGCYKARSVFGDRLPGIIDELNEVLAA